MMMIDISKLKIFVKPGPTDFRKQINGLSIIVQEKMGFDPLNGNLYIFCNKTRNRLKILYWDKTGFCMWFLCKALHKNHYEKKNIMRRNISNFFKDIKLLFFFFA
jgi:transposase